jgi:hypothetical protein
MKSKLLPFFIVLLCFAGIRNALPQITLGIALTNNQSQLCWPSAPANYVLQSTTNPASINWTFVTDAFPVTYGSQTTMTVTNSSTAMFFRLIQIPITTPDGMALIAAGSFTMGDSLDGESDALPTNIYVSAFYMDTNLVSSSQWRSIYTYATNHGYGFLNFGVGRGLNQPVQSVDWFDCAKGEKFKAFGNKVKMEITACGSTISVRLNGVEVLTTSDDSYPTGRIGFRVAGNGRHPSNATYSDVRMQTSVSKPN